MKKVKFFIALIFLSAGVLVNQACSDTEGSEKENKEEAVRAVSVETREVVSDKFTDYIPVIGVVKASERTGLSVSEAGRIKAIVKDKGSYVSKGDTILIIENDILRANLAAAEAQFKLDDMTFKKQEEIYKDNVNSEYQFLQSKFRKDQSKANYDLAKARYDKSFITAPFSGVVDKSDYEIGEFIAPGMPVVELINTNSYKVEVGVPERFVGQLKKGDKAKVILKSINSESLDGVITFVGNSIAIDNRTYPVEIKINSKSESVKPELAAEVYIENGNYDKIITIPEEIITRVDDGYIVFVDENGFAKSRLIQILNRSGQNVAIKSGLNDGDKIIVVGYQNLIDGQRIKTAN